LKSRNQSFIIYILLFIAIIAMVFFTVNQQAGGSDEIPINKLASDIKAGRVKSIIEDESLLEITYKDSDAIKTSTKDENAPLIEQLVELGVTPEDLSAEKISVDIKLPSPFLSHQTSQPFSKHRLNCQLHSPLFNSHRNVLVHFPTGTRKQQYRDILWKIKGTDVLRRTPYRDL